MFTINWEMCACVCECVSICLWAMLLRGCLCMSAYVYKCMVLCVCTSASARTPYPLPFPKFLLFILSVLALFRSILPFYPGCSTSDPFFFCCCCCCSHWCVWLVVLSELHSDIYTLAGTMNGKLYVQIFRPCIHWFRQFAAYRANLMVVSIHITNEIYSFRIL